MGKHCFKFFTKPTPPKMLLTFPVQDRHNCNFMWLRYSSLVTLIFITCDKIFIKCDSNSYNCGATNFEKLSCD